MTLQRLVLVFGLLLGACGGSHDTQGSDMQAVGDMEPPICGPGHDMLMPGIGQACTTDQDCPQPTGGSSTAGQYLLCNYAVADGCSAKGQCRAVPEPSCTSIALACGCDGKAVPTGICFYDSGFAGGPVEPGSHYPADCPVDGGP